MYTELSSLQSKLKELMNENLCPKDFFMKAATLQKDIQRLDPEVGESFIEISKAVDAYHTSKIAMSECMNKCDFELGLRWENVYNSLEKNRD